MNWLRRKRETRNPKAGTMASIVMNVPVYSQWRMSLLFAATVPRMGRSMK